MAANFDPNQVTEALASLLQALPDGAANTDGISTARRRALRGRIEDILARLKRLSGDIDLIKQPPTVFDPSNPDVVGELIARTLLDQPCVAMRRLKRFHGSGVYAIYYNGDFAAYARIRGTNTPIYIGKADPAKPEAMTVEEQGTKLYDRLIGDHARSIDKAKNLDIEDFECRYLVVKSAWQRTAEDYLIQRFKPVWNNEADVCSGLGKHGDKSATRRHPRSPWDILHPGRPWATDIVVPDDMTSDDITQAIQRHFTANPPEQ